MKLNTVKEITKHEQERLDRLYKRADWLRIRIHKEKEKDLTFDKAELSALDWGIEIIEKHFNIEPNTLLRGEEI
jgi:hypothetical protein